MLNVVGATQGALIQSAVVGEEPSRIDAGEDVNMAVGKKKFPSIVITLSKSSLNVL